ncbi:hypothetical protein, partial [Dyella acidisoli]|uniref:hypothetical protein n=1 Tax=Dyella acidisoli TaxID=1867834 RepID=UPI0024E13389
MDSRLRGNDGHVGRTQIAPQFSTTNVDAFLKTLWKTRVRIFAINHLARRDENLRNKCAYFSTAIVESLR